ncbi:hypothetical protein QQ045_011233 [Rhodiola kirilowii]
MPKTTRREPDILPVSRREGYVPKDVSRKNSTENSSMTRLIAGKKSIKEEESISNVKGEDPIVGIPGEEVVDLHIHLVSIVHVGVCFPLGKGVYRVLHIPEEEAVLLNSREKAPYLICVEVLKSEIHRSCQKEEFLWHMEMLSDLDRFHGHILKNTQETYCNSHDRMSSSTSLAIDQAMAHLRAAKIKFVNVNFTVEKKFPHRCYSSEVTIVALARCCHGEDNDTCDTLGSHCNDLEWARVVLIADPGVSMDDVYNCGGSRTTSLEGTPQSPKYNCDSRSENRYGI